MIAPLENPVLGPKLELEELTLEADEEAAELCLTLTLDRELAFPFSDMTTVGERVNPFIPHEDPFNSRQDDARAICVLYSTKKNMIQPSIWFWRI